MFMINYEEQVIIYYKLEPNMIMISFMNLYAIHIIVSFYIIVPSLELLVQSSP
jgi:hypothetical protein